MARLAPGVKPTPHKIRLRGYREDLIRRNGRRINADIEAEAAQALDTILEAARVRNPSAKREPKIRDAISEALISHAKLLTLGK